MLNLILGPSGAGKTSLIDVLVREKGWIAIESVITRPPRPDDKYKRSISVAEYEKLRAAGELWSDVEQLGSSYGILRESIDAAIKDASSHHVLDFNFRKRQSAFGNLPHLSFALLPESEGELERRLFLDGRPERLQQALIDYMDLQSELMVGTSTEVVLVINPKDRLNEAVELVEASAIRSVQR